MGLYTSLYAVPNDLRAFRAQVLAGGIKIVPFDWPAFCYDESMEFDSENPKHGLLQGELLLRVYRHIFSGPTSTLGGKPRGGQCARGVSNGLTQPTPEMIAYVTMMVCICYMYGLLVTYPAEARWALSSSKSLGDDDDQGFRLDDFYYKIIELLDEEAPMRREKFDKTWAEATLAWWKE